MVAAENGHLDVVRYFYQFGYADVTAQNLVSKKQILFILAIAL